MFSICIVQNQNKEHQKNGYLQDSTILDVVNHIHKEEAYGQFRNHIQKYNLTKTSKERLKLTIKTQNLAVSKISMSLRLTISYYNKSILRYKLVLGGFDFEHVFDTCTTEQTLKMEISS